MSENHGGRPTNYREDLPFLLDAYISNCLETQIIPYKEEFCLSNNMTVDNYLDWVLKHPLFSRADKRLEALQKLSLMRGSVTNKLNPASAIFQLKANHGMIETEKRILAGDQENPLYVQLPKRLDPTPKTNSGAGKK